jgi:hypothetical protein
MEAMICASSVLSEIPVIAYRFSIASLGRVIVCTMLEPRFADWLREIGGRFFFASAEAAVFGVLQGILAEMVWQ